MHVLHHLSKSPTLDLSDDCAGFSHIILKKIYLKPKLCVPPDNHSRTLFIALDDKTAHLFLRKTDVEKLKGIMHQCLHFEFSNSGERPVSGGTLLLGIKSGTFIGLSADKPNYPMDENPIITDEFARQLLSCLLDRLCWGHEEDTLHYVSSFAHSLLIHLIYQLQQDTCPHNGRLTPRQLDTVIAYMKYHLPMPITLKELADTIHISPGYLSTRFRQSTGLTPFQYLNKLRMEMAIDLIRQTDLLIIQIGMEVGIENHAQFCRAFKKFYGLSPSQVRKQVDE